MSDSRTSFRDTAVQKAVEIATITFIDNIRNEWRRREQSFRGRLETIRRELEAAETEFQSMEDTTKQDFDYLVSNFPVDRVRPVWEAQGELVPPSIRGLLGELRGSSHLLLSHALFPDDHGTHQQLSEPPVSDKVTQYEMTLPAQASETSRESSSSVQ